MQTSDNDILVKVSRSFILGAVVLGAPTFFIYDWRVEPGKRTAPILGHRVVRVRWYPARFLNL